MPQDPPAIEERHRNHRPSWNGQIESEGSAEDDAQSSGFYPLACSRQQQEMIDRLSFFRKGSSRSMQYRRYSPMPPK